MVGIVGTRPFRDETVERVVEGGARRMSEYADARGDVPPEVVRDRAERHFAESERRNPPGLGARLGAFVSRATGGPSADEVRAARMTQEEAGWTYRNDQGFAIAMADAFAQKPDADVRRLVPGVEGELPTQSSLRWLAVARAAIDIAHEHVDRGDDGGLGPDLGRRVRLETVSREANPGRFANPAIAATQLLENGSAKRATEVRNYMSAGPEVMAAFTRQAMAVSRDEHTAGMRFGRDVDMPSDPIRRQDWARERLLETHAAARAGALDDTAILREASALASWGQLVGDRSRDGTFIRPDAARRAATVPAREADVPARDIEAAPLGVAARAAVAQAASRSR